MGRKGSWFSSIKKTLSPISKEKKIQKSEKQGFVEDHPSAPDPSIVENVCGSYDPPPEEVKPNVVEAEPPKNANPVGAAASTAAATTMSRYSGKLKKEVAAIRIQTAFRGYLARRALWALRGLVRLKTVIEGTNVKRQTANTLKYTQSQYHVQTQINSQRFRMSEENQARQRQRAKEIANLQNGDEWNDSAQSKEEMEAKLLSKYEATMRRERAMAYSFSHQKPWKKAAGATNMLFMDPANPQWGWSWSERYMAARPWSGRVEKDPGNDNSSVKSGVNITRSEIAKSYARYQLNSAPTTPRAKTSGPVGSLKPKPGLSPRPNPDDDSKSVISVTGSVVRNDESLASSPAAVKRMVATSAKGKLRGQGLPESGGGSAKKLLSFSGSPARPRRHSGPPKVETTVDGGVE